MQRFPNSCTEAGMSWDEISEGSLRLLSVLLGNAEKARERSRLQDEKRQALKMEFLGEDSSTWMQYIFRLLLKERVESWKSYRLGRQRRVDLDTVPPLTSCMAVDM